MMKFIDRTGQKAQWECPRCGLWNDMIIHHKDGRIEDINKPCVKCGEDPIGKNWAITGRWVLIDKDRTN